MLGQLTLSKGQLDNGFVLQAQSGLCCITRMLALRHPERAVLAARNAAERQPLGRSYLPTFLKPHQVDVVMLQLADSV